ncbi:MAG: hypothetical protein JRE24_09125 [Deltaproteobacteria bacterium]|nr:hypothetical protein [Deltaproteobacteria bacterium]
MKLYLVISSFTERSGNDAFVKASDTRHANLEERGVLVTTLERFLASLEMTGG